MKTLKLGVLLLLLPLLAFAAPGSYSGNVELEDVSNASWGAVVFGIVAAVAISFLALNERVAKTILVGVPLIIMGSCVANWFK